MQQTLTNEQIFNIATMFEKYPISDDTYIPAAANFYIQKNINKIMQLKIEIDNCRFKIISHYGEPISDTEMKIKEEFLETAKQELKTLSDIKQEIDIQMIPIAALLNTSLTVGQIKSLMFMLEESPATTVAKEPIQTNKNTTYVPLI